MAKLTEAQRHEIARRRVRGEEARALAVEFGVSIANVYRAARLRRSGPVAPSSQKWRTWPQKLERLRASGKLTEFVFKAPN